jgi:isocitrate dehydrogenase kinase/phosphatase
VYVNKNVLYANNQAEIVGTDITVDGDRSPRVFNIYCQPNMELSLDAMETTHANCLLVGYFKSHSDRWGYAETDSRGAKMEDCD